MIIAHTMDTMFDVDRDMNIFDLQHEINYLIVNGTMNELWAVLTNIEDYMRLCNMSRCEKAQWQRLFNIGLLAASSRPTFIVEPTPLEDFDF